TRRSWTRRSGYRASWWTPKRSNARRRSATRSSRRASARRRAERGGRSSHRLATTEVHRAPERSSTRERGAASGSPLLLGLLADQRLPSKGLDARGHVLGLGDGPHVVVADVREQARRERQGCLGVRDQVELHLVVAREVAVL